MVVARQLEQNTAELTTDSGKCASLPPSALMAADAPKAKEDPLAAAGPAAESPTESRLAPSTGHIPWYRDRKEVWAYALYTWQNDDKAVVKSVFWFPTRGAVLRVGRINFTDYCLVTCVNRKGRRYVRCRGKRLLAAPHYARKEYS